MRITRSLSFFWLILEFNKSSSSSPLWVETVCEAGWGAGSWVGDWTLPPIYKSYHKSITLSTHHTINFPRIKPISCPSITPPTAHTSYHISIKPSHYPHITTQIVQAFYHISTSHSFYKHIKPPTVLTYHNLDISPPAVQASHHQLSIHHAI